MPDKRTIKRARKDKRQGKSASTQAGEFVRSEIDKIRKGKHGARSTKQAIAIGLSEARRAGVKLPPKPGSKSAKKKTTTRRVSHKVSSKRSRATLRALRREPTSTVSHKALSRQTKQAARRRTAAQRHQAAMKAVHTKGHLGLKRAAQKAAHTREHRVG